MRVPKLKLLKAIPTVDLRLGLAGVWTDAAAFQHQTDRAPDQSEAYPVGRSGLQKGLHPTGRSIDAPGIIARGADLLVI